MTDREIIETIATKVMGWVERQGAWVENGREVENMGWNPLKADYDCMAAWDRFSRDKGASIIHGREYDGFWYASVTYSNGFYVEHADADRRRAMCECMVRAASA